jgi:cofilin
MVYASSKDALRKAFVGIGEELQANDEDEIEYDYVLDKISKSKGKKPTRK